MYARCHGNQERHASDRGHGGEVNIQIVIVTEMKINITSIFSVSNNGLST